MSALIRTESLTVRYGKTIAVDAVTLDVPAGSVYALLGRNGAGKSSLVRCLVGQQRPQHGRAVLLGEDVWTRREQLMARVAIVPEEADAPPNMRVAGIAAFSQRLYPKWDAAAVDERLRRFSSPPKAKFGTLSKGQKKQVMVAMALAISPEVLILDDPTLGLDVVARKSLFDEVIGELAERGTTILVTTHDLAGIETLADRVGMMRGGQLVVDETMESLKARFRRIRTASAPVALAGGDFATAAIRQWGSGTEAVVSNFDEVAFERFRSGGAGHTEVTPMTLEEIFIAVAGEEA